MFTYRALRIGVVAAVLLVLLAAAGAPVQAQPVRPSPAQAVQIAGFGERIWHFVVSLWARAFAEEGVTIDPNGGKSGLGAVSPNPPDLTDEGVTIDPDGHR
jgi:nitrous oxidase accessory protein NosD